MTTSGLYWKPVFKRSLGEDINYLRGLGAEKSVVLVAAKSFRVLPGLIKLLISVQVVVIWMFVRRERACPPQKMEAAAAKREPLSKAASPGDGDGDVAKEHLHSFPAGSVVMWRVFVEAAASLAADPT